jgi:ABC-type multidrug transport system ATPase subunit
MTESIIEMSGVTKQFGKKVVLNDLTFRLRPGTVTGLLGKNGAGKIDATEVRAGTADSSAGTNHRV